MPHEYLKCPKCGTKNIYADEMKVMCKDCDDISPDPDIVPSLDYIQGLWDMNAAQCAKCKHTVKDCCDECNFEEVESNDT